MNSAIFVGQVMHARLAPVAHVFRYPLYMYGFDLDEIGSIEKANPLFGYNKRRPVSLHDGDYFRGEKEPIKDRALRAIREKGVEGPIERVFLVTAARYFNYVFNPVSFYYFFRPGGVLAAAIAEVNNTFKERHLYVLTSERSPKPGFLARYTVPKDFHVSPFNDMEGDYDFHLGDVRNDLDIRLNILRDETPSFQSRLTGRRLPLTSANMARVLVQYPLTASLTMPRILYEAARLHYGKRLPVFTKPTPASTMTIGIAPATLAQRAAMAFARRFFAKVRTGRLSIELPGGECWHFGDESSPRSALIRVRSHAFFTRLLKDADIGFGEAWIEGEWESPDLVALLELLIDNFHLLEARSPLARTFGRMATKARAVARRNSLSGSRRNIEEHYDLGNEFFASFLDPTMMYSCGLFETAETSLEEAQTAKIRRLIDLARIEPGQHVLEIGSGWGSFAIEAARSRNCRVTTITLSREQERLVRERVVEEGLEDLVEVRRIDYRELEGSFDRIVSIEMLEAVGHENLGAYFAACDRLLRPDGLLVLQVITMPDQRYDDYRKHGDYIERFVFPGSVCPSLSALSDAMRLDSTFTVESLENIGPHYARTLELWRERFLESWGRIRKLGFDERFKRLWIYYLAYCEAGFRKRMINDLHLVLTRSNNAALPTFPRNLQ